MQTGKELFKKIIIDGLEVDIDAIDANNGVYGNIPLSKTKIKVLYVYNDNVTSIPAGVFSGISSLKKVRFPSNIVSIADDAFTGSGIDSDSISTIKAINTRSFRYPITLSVSLQSVTVQENGSVSLPTVTASSNNSTVAGLTYTYLSSDTSKVTISNGVLNGIASGTATITVTFAGNDNYSGATVQYNVNVSVTEKPELPNVTVSVSNYTYGGTKPTPSVSGNIENGAVTYSYAQDGSDLYSANLPDNYGNYKVKAIIAETTNYRQTTIYGTFKVLSAAGNIDISGKTLSYTGSSLELITIRGASGTVHYKVNNGDWSTTKPTANQAGDYTIYYYVDPSPSAEMPNYKGVASEQLPLYVLTTIAVSQKPAGSVSTHPTSSSPVYNSGDYLCTAGSGTGTIKYKVGNGEWSSSRPTATEALNAGNYTLYYKAAESNDYAESSESHIEVTILKAQGKITTAPTENTLTYNGKDQVLITLGAGSGTMEYKLEGESWNEALPKGKNAGTYTVYYRAKESTNYTTSSSNNFDVEINKVTPTVTAPKAASNLKYDGSAKTLINAGSTNYGTLKYSIDGTNYSTDLPTASTVRTHTVYYMVQGDSNINTVTAQTISVTIAKGDGSVTTPPTAKEDLTYTGKAQAFFDDNTKGSGTGNMAYKVGDNGSWSSSIPTAIKAGDYTVYYKAIANDNYNESAVSSLTCSIAKAAPTITKYPAAASDLTYTGKAIALITLGETSHGHFWYTINKEQWLKDESPTATKVGKYTVYWSLEGDENHTEIDYTDTEPITVEIISGEEEEPTVDVSATSEAITETSEGTDTTHVKFKFVNNTGETLQLFVILTKNDNESFNLVIINKNCPNEGSVTLSYDTAMTPFTPPESWGENLGNIYAYENTNHVRSYVALCTASSYVLGLCYTITFTTLEYSNNNTVSSAANTGSVVPSTKKIGIKVKNNTDESITINKVEFKTNNNGTVTNSGLLNISTSAVTINSNKTSDICEIDISDNPCKGLEFASDINNIILYDSNDNALISAETSGSLTVGTLYTITYGDSGSLPVVGGDDDIATHDWNYDNYILDSAIDSFIVNNYNMGSGTYNTDLGWEKLNDKAKRELIVNASATSEFDPPYIYETHYAEYDGYKKVNKILVKINDGEREEIPVEYNNYVFNEITKLNYDSAEEHHYKLGGPLTCLGAGANSDTRKYFEIVRYIADNAARDPEFNLNRGRRVRPLGGVDKDYRIGNSEMEAIGDKWNSLYNGSLCAIISPEAINNVEVNADAPTSYPSGHSAQAWMLAILATLAKYIENDSNWGLSGCLDFISKLYRIGVYRTVERFHWNSDTMYGRLWATMLAPVINAISDLDDLYDSIRGTVSGSIPTYNNDNADFEELEAKFENIVNITQPIKNYLYSMYSAAKTVLDTQNHVFLSSDTYPEVYPLEGYTVKVNGVSKVIKYRGDNIKYRKGTTELDNISREQIMQSWLMAMCLAELYCDLDTLKYTFDSDVMDPNNSKYNPNYTYVFTNPDPNTQTLLFALAYELGGGREVNLYDEYKIDYDPTILRLAASLVYATERSKYSADIIRGLNNNTITFNTNFTETEEWTFDKIKDSINSRIGCTARGYRRTGDAHVDYFTVGYGVSTYYIFNDAPGPYYATDSGLLEGLPAPFHNKWRVGTKTLQLLHQDISLFNVVKINLSIVNNSGQDILLSGEINLYLDPKFSDGTRESISCILDPKVDWGSYDSYIAWDETLKNGETGDYTNCILIPGKNGAAPWPHFYLNENLLTGATVYTPSSQWGHISLNATVTLGGKLVNGGTYTITLNSYDPA